MLPEGLSAAKPAAPPPRDMGCVLSVRRYRVPFRQHSIYGLPPGAKLEPLYEFLRRMFPVETEEAEDEDNEIKLTHKRTVREQLEEEEERNLAGVGMFNEIAIDVASEESTRGDDEEELEAEEEWWEITTDDHYSRDESMDRYSRDDNT